MLDVSGKDIERATRGGERETGSRGAGLHSHRRASRSPEASASREELWQYGKGKASSKDGVDESMVL